jgi:signal transduction histidine kinase
MWDRYASFLIVAAIVVFAQSALIGGLLIQHTRRRQAEALVLKNQVDLQRSYDRIRDLGRASAERQESERSRVARDLHDDISQQMALLEIDLEQLAGVVEGDAQDLTAETLHRRKKSDAACMICLHRLHPAKLRLIGLVAALQGLAPGVVAAGVRDHVYARECSGALPEELALCLFRIVQEALHNAIKYSRGRKGVGGLGKAGPAGLTLTIVTTASDSMSTRRGAKASDSSACASGSKPWAARSRFTRSLAPALD